MPDAVSNGGESGSERRAPSLPDCPEGDAALSSTLWSGGRSRAWTSHLAVCATCAARQARAVAERERVAADEGSGDDEIKTYGIGIS